ncbi:MAG: gliding motility-associated C-terminal domain-containing protein [Bacteroidota bacterium]
MKFLAFLVSLSFTLFTFFKGLSQEFIDPFSVRINAASDEKTDSENAEWNELVAERTLYSSTFVTGSGMIKSVFSKEPINYMDKAGHLQAVQSFPELFRPINGYAALQQQYPTYVLGNGAFAVTTEDEQRIVLGGNSTTVDGMVFTGQPAKRKEDILIGGNLSWVQKQLLFRQNAIKYNYILQWRPASGELIIRDELQIPPDFRIVEENGTLLILDREGIEQGSVRAPLCYDANGKWCLAELNVESNGEKTFIKLVVPASWMDDAVRTFPIVVDPVVTGPTSFWNGGTMPSCITPTYNEDSIQVTIPGGVNVTGLFVTASFYADPFTTAIMSQGEMRFRTSCATSQSFTVTGNTGTLPGTAYLDSFNVFNPLTCCLPESCEPTSFYLTMLLGRTGPGTGCNTNFIRYDPFTTQWPFQAVIVGKTAESYGNKWVVPQSTICSNTCTIVGLAYANQGVAPYTFSHPWSTEVVTTGQNNGCSNGATNHQFTLTIPNCPIYCDTVNTTLTVPPPVIVDACGTVITGIPDETVTLKPTPEVLITADTLVCSGTPFTIGLQSCIPQAPMVWAGNNQQGSGSISDTFFNSSDQQSVTNYIASTSLNGCNSDTVSINMYVEPNPQAAFSWSPDPVIVSVPVVFSDGTQNYSANLDSWSWDLGDQSQSTDQNPGNTYLVPGTYAVCLDVETATGCTDTLCQPVIVAPATVVAPNVITANEDGVNDLLAFQFLEFYPDNELVVLNRWGNTVFTKNSYTNDWDGGDLTEGTYFYHLIVNDGEQEYKGFFQLVR